MEVKSIADELVNLAMLFKFILREIIGILIFFFIFIFFVQEGVIIV